MGKLKYPENSIINENLPKYILETTNVETINFLKKIQNSRRKIENYTNCIF